MKRIWAPDCECRRLQSRMEEACAVCNAMRMRNEQKVTPTFQADCAQYLHGPLVLSTIKSALVHLTVMSRPACACPEKQWSGLRKRD